MRRSRKPFRAISVRRGFESLPLRSRAVGSRVFGVQRRRLMLAVLAALVATAVSSGSGGAEADALHTCLGQAVTMRADSSSRAFVGTPRADVIQAAPGGERIFAGRGDDVICGGSGNDLLEGGRGDDMISGSP